LVAAVLLGPAALAAQAPAALQQDSTVAFDFQAADLQVVVSALAEAAGINIVYGDLPSRPVTLRTSRPVRLSEVRSLLESVALGNSLELIEQNGLIRIVSTEPVVEEPRGRAQPGFQAARRLFIHPLRHARAEDIVMTLRTLFGLGTDFYGSVGMSDLSLSRGLDQQRQAAYREVQISREPPPVVPQEVGGQMGVSMGLESAVDLVPDLLTNSVLILSTPEDFQVLEEAIDQLDTRPLQVLIEVTIAEVRRNSARDLGVTIDVPLEEGKESGVTFQLQGSSAGDVALGVLGIGDVKATVVLQALAADGEVAILSRPVVLAQNNQQARILVGDQRPFIQVFRALPTDNAVRDQVVQYRNVGTQLHIRPTINADGYVNLSVLQEVSVATSEVQFGAPVINTREAETELSVKDGHTVVLGGLIDQQTQNLNSGVPFLKDIPLLGLLFRSTSTQKITTELFLLLTPHVIRTDEEMSDVTRQLRESTENLDRELPEDLLLLPSAEEFGDTLPRPQGPESAPPDTSALPQRRGEGSE
jgi:general secretion pathway protein D